MGGRLPVSPNDVEEVLQRDACSGVFLHPSMEMGDLLPEQVDALGETDLGAVSYTHLTLPTILRV